MARWKLTAAHYIKVPGTEWEYKETARATGKQKVLKLPVPLLLDPEQPADWNYPGMDGGDIIVCHEGKGEPRDYVFEGEPTPDMFPLDDEARAITKELEKKWKHPINDLPGSYADGIQQQFEKQLTEAMARAPAQAPAPQQDITELLAAITTMVKQNQEIVNQLVGNQQPPTEEPKAAAGGRRI